ncbi:formate dehydrogenase accessory protein FdhD [Inhella inkyongensis]|uniref:Sulfur carrier protein FdhD n=1 Tax=Inhella inkyongensis TaxID=392593 RepID=A0A840S355_9BURK|nr:formate dehydrogenase accessory protein FdhD [Inhella inkyongensis]
MNPADIDWARPSPEAFALGHSPGGSDALIEETPVTLVFNDEVALTLMATPLQGEELALGFTLSEGLIERADEIQELHALPTGAGLSVLISLPEARMAPLRARRRFGAAPGGCGLCGIEDQQTLLALPERALTTLALEDGAIARALQALPAHQPLNAATGGAHAAAWCSAAGEILLATEDVSRHCALDKLIGLLARTHQDPAQGFVLMSSRASFELVHKAARVGLPALVAISAPTALALRAAQACGLALYGFAREGRHTRYA